MVAKGSRTISGKRTKASILEATLRLLGRAGPEAFSASVLAKEAGVSKATLFHHFASIDEIPLAALEQYWLRALAVDTGKPESTRDYLDGLGQQILALADERGEFLRAHAVLLTKAIFDSRLRQRLAAGAREMHRVIVQELSSRLPDSLPVVEIDAMARMAEMTLDGLMIALVTRQSRKELAEAKQAWNGFVDLLLLRAEAI